MKLFSCSIGRRPATSLKILASSFLVVAFLTAPCAAAGLGDGNSSRIGTEIKALSLSSGMSLTYGWRYLSSESERFFLGGAAYTGQLGTNGGSLTQAGFVSGHRYRWGSGTEFSMQLLAGAISTRSAAGVSDGGLTLEPSLNLGFVVGPSTRTVVNAGYVWTPASTTAGGLAFGLRFEFLMGSAPAGGSGITPSGAASPAAPSPQASGAASKTEAPRKP